MKTLDITVEGEKFTIRRYTVAEKVKIAKKSGKDALLAMGQDLEKMYKLTREIVAFNTGLKEEDLLEYDNVQLDMLYVEINKYNTLPLESKEPLKEQSSETTAVK